MTVIQLEIFIDQLLRIQGGIIGNSGNHICFQKMRTGIDFPEPAANAVVCKFPGVLSSFPWIHNREKLPVTVNAFCLMGRTEQIQPEEKRTVPPLTPNPFFIISMLETVYPGMKPGLNTVTHLNCDIFFQPDIFRIGGGRRIGKCGNSDSGIFPGSSPRNPVHPFEMEIFVGMFPAVRTLTPHTVVILLNGIVERLILHFADFNSYVPHNCLPCETFFRTFRKIFNRTGMRSAKLRWGIGIFRKLAPE